MKHRYPAAVRVAVCVALCGAALSGRQAPAAQNADKTPPPPVPLYSADVTKTTVFGPGMIVIKTKDSFAAVRDWYQANLKDRTADVALDTEHHRYVTHDGASVDVAAEGSGPDAGTTIALFWKSDAGLLPSPGSAPQPDRAVAVQLIATPTRIAPLPRPADLQFAAAAPLKIEPLSQPRATPEPSDSRTPELQGATYLKEGRYGEALLALEDAAANGSVVAALNLGMMYDAGLGVPQSYAGAFSWYQVAAEKGDPIAIFNIGALNDGGLGQRRNPAAAVDRYTQAAAKGVGRAAFNLALLYESGDGVEQDSRAAEQYFRQAERLGIHAARAHLPGRNPRPADAGDSDLPFNTVHAIGGDSPEKRAGDATAHIQRQALQGDPVALYDLAYHLEKGIGREADPHGAFRMYQQVAYDARDDRLKTAATAAAAHLAAGGLIQ
ncbi:MAG TPA: tetratricopeptide repeat protein [Alphaproteobacteria bacterium]|jgi:TPR repeat protein|nr:tetratricopeptide repeat protein [Alphaproteobacteria bacterium]